MQTYQRSYTANSSEYDRRRALFETTREEVDRQNSKPGALWRARINQFADHTAEEVAAYHGYAGGARPQSSTRMLAALGHGMTRRNISGLPKFKSWKYLKSLEPEKVIQQECGNCWAAASAAMLEAHHEIHMGRTRHFNFHEITQCTRNRYNCGGQGGCNGATAELAMAHVLTNGMSKVRSHAYHSDVSTAPVHCPAHMVAISEANEAPPHEWGPGLRMGNEVSRGSSLGIVGWERLAENALEPLMRALVTRGPVAVAVATGWRNYGTGIYDSCKKDDVIGHAMLLIGYGEDRRVHDTKYWTIRNSWGTHWGERGNMRLLRHDDEETWCGTDRRPQDGTTCDDGPTEVRICGSCGILYDSVVPIFKQVSAESTRLAKLRGEETE